LIASKIQLKMKLTNNEKDIIIKEQELIELAESAAREIMRIYTLDDRELEYKDDSTPLTLADRISSEIIVKGLRKLYPHIPVVSEEDNPEDIDPNALPEYFWLVDPLDGTKEFVARNGEFAINIALIKGKQPVYGLIHIPAKDETVWAIKGKGAFSSQTGPLRKRTEKLDMESEGLKIAASRSYISKETLSYNEKFNAPELIPKGSSLKYVMLAKGEADIYPRFGRTMEWDTAAGQVIIEETGGKIVDAYTDKDFEYRKKDFANTSFIAYSAAHD
jgi:3'(2'), 5'-bisphosphate nucleotidase